MAQKVGRDAGKPDCVRFRGCAVSEEPIHQIREVIRQNPKALRRRVASPVCRAWKWRRPNGELNVRACLDLLARLQRPGQIKVLEGKPRRARRRAAAPEPKYWTTAPAILGPPDVELTLCANMGETSTPSEISVEGEEVFEFLGEFNQKERCSFGSPEAERSDWMGDPSIGIVTRVRNPGKPEDVKLWR